MSVKVAFTIFLWINIVPRLEFKLLFKLPQQFTVKRKSVSRTLLNYYYLIWDVFIKKTFDCVCFYFMLFTYKKKTIAIE